jgi:hypothetical protein
MFHARSARRVRAYRPRLEILEDRTLPSTFLVDHLADDAVGSGLNGSLRYALTNAADNDHITFGVTGTINLTGVLPTLAHSISIDGPGAAQLTVRHNTGGNYGIFTAGTGATVSISGLSITNGQAQAFGGGIFNDHGTLTVSDCSIDGNWAGNSGGGIYNRGTLTVSNCTIGSPGNGNMTAGGGVGFGLGAGIYNRGTLTLSNSTVSGNEGVYGGGIANVSGDLTILYSTISGNTVFVFSGGGGGIYNEDGTVTLSNSTVSGNHADPPGDGGGIDNYGTVTLNNSTVSGNSAAGYGGGIANYGTVTLNNSTVSGNSSFASGGGIYNNYPDFTLHARNTIIAGNTALDGAPDLYDNLGSLGHNLIGNTQGGYGFDVTDLLNVNPLLGPLQDNGGPTQTMPLLAGSPALNAGDPAQLGMADQRGVVRSGGVNIGAYQASATAFSLPAPATATAGTPFDATLKAVDPFGQPALGYTGRVTFTSADPHGATLPADYTFTAADHGVHLFPGGATLYTAGTWDVTATDTGTGSITGSASVSMNPAAADHLLFLQQPTDTPAGQTISPVVVEVVDQFGNVETSDNSDTITLALGSNPGGGTLSGTLSLTVVNGVATFSDLSIDQAGDGYTLHAATPGLADADSAAFVITV